jgi:hypothetical protein
VEAAQMPNKELLEDYPLYRKYEIFNTLIRELPKVRIKMHCDTCKTDQTFAMINEYTEVYQAGMKVAARDFRLTYRCAHCSSFFRRFHIYFSPSAAKKSTVMKIGQYPAWDISGNPEIERLLGDHSSLYIKSVDS